MAVASRSDAIVYAIGVRDNAVIIAPGRVLGPPGITDDRFLTRLARDTGGRLCHAQQHRDIESTFTRVLEEFNSRYVLGYTPRGVAPAGTRSTSGSRASAAKCSRGADTLREIRQETGDRRQEVGGRT